ncbi:hypothetical protein K227x_28340 [Rubripirellula lacrimiformis]|uniref:Uncharacterized protein n=1 Tax=Rubripirellula lacrimiformis TaxID=1930273 RepID=A0A517NBD8_9BACT|nr:hypothetical protein [Rubripirellula lacrimiformis]QDT04443.1 hypothetical protein K227x_28340 [Rubripirellula lacrimiformis]
MKFHLPATIGLLSLCFGPVADTALAQFQIRIGNGRITTGRSVRTQPQVEHHDHVIRDSHGHVQGIQHHDVIRDNARRISRPTIVAPHIDHHDHVIRDSHGHVVRREHHDVVHNGWSHVVPSTIRGYNAGQYYVENNQYYYQPQQSATHVVARPALLPFGGFSQYEDLSGRLETLVNELLLDLHYNYSHNHGFQETYAEGYQLLGVAKFIHEAEHNRDMQAMRSQLSGMDQLFHHIEDDVRGWSRHHHRQIGTLGIVAKTEMIEATLHHLMHDVGVSLDGQGVEQAPPPVQGVEQAPPPMNLPRQN